jgi:tetratricopeptide (TPR) repeat protein
MKFNKHIKTLLYPALMLTVMSCSSEPASNILNTENSKANTAVKEYQLTEMLERDSSLAYDEYIKLQAKFETLKTQLELNKNDYQTQLKIAEIYIYEARVSGEHPYYYTAALSIIENILSHKVELSQDQLFTALFYKSTVQLSQHNFNEALVTGKKALAMNDKNAGIYGVLVDANVEIGNYDQAVIMCDKMLEIRPDLRSYSRTSYLREIYGDLPGSKKAMHDAINAGAPYSEYKCWAITTLGKMYESEGQLDSAMICYDFAMQERENYPFGIAGKARVNLKKGNTENAEKLYNSAIKILPEIGFNIELAELKKKEGDMKSYNKMVSEIEVMFQEDIESGHNMNLEYANFLYSFKGDFDKALELGLQEAKNRPNNIDVNKLLAFVYHGLNQDDKAMMHLAKATATEKNDADLICLSGLIGNNNKLIMESLALNPYQNHYFSDEAKNQLK